MTMVRFMFFLLTVTRPLVTGKSYDLSLLNMVFVVALKAFIVL